MSLLASTRSETTKVFSTATWWILAIVLVFYVGSTAGGVAALFGGIASGDLGGGEGQAIPPTVSLAPSIYAVATSVGYVFPLLVGALMVTGEFRHKTLTPTFLATPRRGIALFSKVVVAIFVGLIYGVIAIGSAVGPGAGILAAFGVETELGNSDTWALLGRALLALVIWTIVGVGLGAFLRNQVIAIVVVLAFTQFVEPIARLAGGFVDWVGDVTQFLPGAAGDALVGASLFESFGGAPSGTSGLEWWAGGLVLAGYAAIFLLLGWATSWRRDVT